MDNVKNNSNNSQLNGLEELIQQYTGQPDQVEEAPQPRTFVIECNKRNAQQDGNNQVAHQWTNHFPAVKLKRGDIVSVNSAFLSSRGSGDLLNFDSTNNKTRIVFEYYATHDNTNNKKVEYNLSYSQMPLDNVGTHGEKGWNGMSFYDTGTTNRNQPCWESAYPCNYRPMRMYRLMKTFEVILSTSNVLPAPIGQGDGADLIQFTNPTTTPKTADKEPFWGYKNSPMAVVGSVEDAYVPCLYRTPKISVEELVVSQNAGADTNLFKQKWEHARIWYVATQKSKFGGPPVGGSASMRIYFAGTGGLYQNTDRNDILTDSMNLVRNFRVGQYINFWGTRATFGINAYNPNSFEVNKGVQEYGPRIYYCSGYASDGEGHNGGTADTFKQFGYRGAETGNAIASWKTNPMGMIMKITKIYTNSSALYPNGNNRITEQGKTDLEHCPYIDVACDGAISLAWGNPNAYTWANNPNGIGSPYNNGPLGGIPTAGNPPPFEKSTHEQGINIRTWCCNNNQQIDTNGIAPSGETIAEGNYFPIEEHRNKTCYVACINNNFNIESDINYRRTGHNAEYKEGLLSQTTGTFSQFQQATIGNNTSLGIENNSLPQTLPSINYNLRCLNNEGGLDDTAFADKVLQEGTYPGGRFPSMYVNGNDYSQYTSDKYWEVNREETMSYGSALYPMYIENLQDAQKYAGGNSNNNPLQSPKGANPTRQSIPEWASQSTNHTGIYIQGKTTAPIRFYIGAGVSAIPDFIDNQSAFHNYNYNDTLTGEATSGMDNFVIACGNLPDKADLGTQNDPPTQGPQTQNIPKDFTLFGGYKSYTPNQGGTGFPLWEENNWSEKTITETINGQKYTTTYSQGAIDMSIIMGQMEEKCYIRMTDPVSGRTEVMYVMFLTGFFNLNDSTQPYFGNQALIGDNFKSYVNTTNANNMFPGQKTIPRMYIIKRDVLGTGKQNFRGFFDNLVATDPLYNKINVDNLNRTTGSLATTSYFEIVDSLGDLIHHYNFKDAPRNILPSNQEFITNTANAKDVISGQAGQGQNNSYGYGGSDFIITSVPNMPYFDDGASIERMTEDTIWLYKSCIHTEPPNSTANSGGKTIGSQGNLSWDIHYDYKDIGVDSDVVYYSTSDVASTITKQLQKSEDLYKTNNSGGRNPSANGVIPNSAGKVPMSSLFRTIHGPCGRDNYEDTSAQTIGGTLHEGDFCWFVAVKNQYFNRFNNQENWRGQGNLVRYEEDTSHFPKDGFYKVFPQNSFSSVNRNPTTKVFFNEGWTKYDGQLFNVGRPYNFKQWFVPNNRIDTDETQAFEPADMYGYDQCSGTQFIGTNTPTLIYNDQYSRFEFQYLHQPLYSRMTQQNSSDSNAFGNVICNVWSNALIGQDNWDRVGGINVVNWSSPQYAFGEKNGIEDDFLDPLTDEDSVGSKFMTKLGFTASWRATNSGSTSWEEDGTDAIGSLSYKPLGTTRSDFNINQSISYTSFNSTMRPPQFDTTDYTYDRYYSGRDGNNNQGTTDYGKLASYFKIQGQSDYTNDFLLTATGSDGSTPMDLNNPNPNTYINVDSSKNIDSRDIDDGAYLSYRPGTNEFSPPDYVITTDGSRLVQFNQDDIKCSYYQYQVGTSGLQAPDLPTKNEIGYFFIMSDLIDKHEFYGSANDGSNLNAIAILSKNYTSNDFFFSFQSPVQFYIKQDKTITSITQRILTPDLQAPIGIDDNSAIIYTIERPNPVPEPDVPPVFLQQAYDYALSEQLSAKLGIPFQGFMGGSMAGVSQPSSAYAGSGGSLNQLRQSLVQSVLNPSNNQASQILNTETEIASNLMRMPLASRIRAIRTQGVAEDPTQALLPTIPAEQLGLQPSVNVVPDIQDPAIDPEVLARELSDMGESLEPSRAVSLAEASLEPSRAVSYGSEMGSQPLEDPEFLPGFINPTDEEVRQFAPQLVAKEQPDSAIGSVMGTAPQSYMPSRLMTRQASPEPAPPRPPMGLAERQRRAERRSVERQGGNPEDLGKQLESKLREAQGGISLYTAIAYTTGNHPSIKSGNKHNVSNWINKDSSLSWGNKTKPHENPYDIRTWTASRLQHWKNNHFFHLKDEFSPKGTGKLTKQEIREGKTDIGKNMIRSSELKRIKDEIARRGSGRALNYGKTDYKVRKDGKQPPNDPPAYKKQSDRPAGWTNHATAHLHPRGITQGDRLPQQQLRVMPDPPSAIKSI